MRKVAIVGSSETRDFAPYHDESWEIWTLNDMYSICPRIDRLFEMHDEVVLVRDAATHPAIFEEIKWLKENTSVDVILRKTLDWVPKGQEYPLEAIVKEFGDYFTNSVSYMIALALYEGVDELGIWGVDMAHGTEYAAQRPSCEYFIGIARGRGVPVTIPKGSSLLAVRFLYGEENKMADEIESRIKSLTEQKANWVQQKTEALLNEHKLQGNLETLYYVKTVYGN